MSFVVENFLQLLSLILSSSGSSYRPTSVDAVQVRGTNNAINAATKLDESEANCQ